MKSWTADGCRNAMRESYWKHRNLAEKEPEKFIDETVAKLKEEVSGKALIAFSGGVDSAVCAALVNKAIGKQLVAVHVDTGYMRKDESKNVKKQMENIGLNFHFIDASKEFYAAL